MKPKIYKLIENCVEDGITMGYYRAHKHTETPTEDQVKDEILSAIMLEISEWFDFDLESME